MIRNAMPYFAWFGTLKAHECSNIDSWQIELNWRTFTLITFTEVNFRIAQCTYWINHKLISFKRKKIVIHWSKLVFAPFLSHFVEFISSLICFSVCLRSLSDHWSYWSHWKWKGKKMCSKMYHFILTGYNHLVDDVKERSTVTMLQLVFM